MSIPTAEEFGRIIAEHCDWVAQQEQFILDSGDALALTDEQQADAKRIGVICPGRVRLLKVPEIPSPPYFNAPEKGLAARYGIFIRGRFWGERCLVVHELVHTMQFEQRGSIENFLRPYLFECLYPPFYPNGPMEQEAKRFEDECSHSWILA